LIPNHRRTHINDASLFSWGRRDTSSTMNELVHWLSRVQYLRRGFTAADGQRSIDKAELDEHRGLIPVQMLVRDLVTRKLDDGDERELHAVSGRRNAGQEPIHADRVSEANNQLIDHSALPDGPRDGNDLGVGRDL